MVQIKIKNTSTKKGILFTIAIIIIILPLFLLSLSFSDKNISTGTIYIDALEANKLIFIENDIIKNAYSDLLNINLGTITRGSTITIKLNQALLMPDKDYLDMTDNYKKFIEGEYAKLNHIGIKLLGFNNSFRILPYNTTFKIDGKELYLFTMPLSTNYVMSITLNVRVNSSFISDNSCEGVGNDKGKFPAVTTVTVTYVNISGGTCSQSNNLNPRQDNNKGNGRQFYQALINPEGSIETKFGEVNRTDGVLAISAINTVANITQLDIQYSQTNMPAVLVGGNISLTTGITTKNTVIILAEE